MTLPRPPARVIAHVVARKEFEVFAELCFHFLHQGETLTRNWHLSAMAQALEEAERGERRRLLITLPPRHMKSLFASVAFPAWAIGRDPTRRIICASYNHDLAVNFSRDCRKVMQSAWYAEVFPKVGALARATEADLATKAGGFRYATALGGSVTGFGADIIIIDDLMKAADASFPEARERARRFIDETLLSRLDDKRAGVVIAIQQRLHEDDPAAHLLEKGGYRHLNFPSRANVDEEIPLTRGRVHRRRIGDLLDPVRHPASVLDELRAEMGARAFEAQYQQNPVPPEGGHVRWDRIQFYEAAPERETLRAVVQSWDVASTDTPRSDYSVGTTWGHDGEAWLLIDLVRVRMLHPDLLDLARGERRQWRPDVILVESVGAGIPLLQQMRRDGQDLARQGIKSAQVISPSTRLGKVERMNAGIERLYAGAARLPRAAPWLEVLRHELLAFPDGRHDDQVDSVSQFLQWTHSPWAKKLAGVQPVRPLGSPAHIAYNYRTFGIRPPIRD